MGGETQTSRTSPLPRELQQQENCQVKVNRTTSGNRPFSYCTGRQNPSNLPGSLRQLETPVAERLTGLERTTEQDSLPSAMKYKSFQNRYENHCQAMFCLYYDCSVPLFVYFFCFSQMWSSTLLLQEIVSSCALFTLLKHATKLLTNVSSTICFYL